MNEGSNPDQNQEKKKSNQDNESDARLQTLPVLEIPCKRQPAAPPELRPQSEVGTWTSTMVMQVMQVSEEKKKTKCRKAGCTVNSRIQDDAIDDVQSRALLTPRLPKPWTALHRVTAKDEKVGASDLGATAEWAGT